MRFPSGWKALFFCLRLGASSFLKRYVVSTILVERLKIYFCRVGGARGGGDDMVYDLLFPSEKACSAETRFCLVG